jgi:outer membrane protein TolC
MERVRFFSIFSARPAVICVRLGLSESRKIIRGGGMLVLGLIMPAVLPGRQEPEPPRPGQVGSSGPSGLTISLKEAFERARTYGLQIQAADILARLAHEDRVQARAGALPSLNALNQFIYTEGNGTPSGVFVANDGVHVYNEQAVVHQEVLALARRGEIRLAAAAEAVARARVEIAARGLNAIVVQDYYGIASAEQKAMNAERSLSEARRFLDVTQKQEGGGEVAHSDVIKAQLQVQQRTREVQDAELGVLKAKVALGVLIFPNLETNYEIVDDLAQLPSLPELTEVAAQTNASSPDLRASQLALRQSRLATSVARYGFLPSLSLDFFYGINANQFAARTSYATQATGRSTLPNYLVPFRQNLGYSGQVTLNVPVWNWGATYSRVKQANLRRQQAEYDLSATQRNIQAQLASGYAEAKTALSQVQSLRESVQLSEESLRLTLLRYQAGEATALEVVDAQSTANLARSSYVDGLYRYRVALAVLQTLTGNFQP